MRVKTIYASEFAKLNSDVYAGGGTDDTAAIQKILDMAQGGDGVHLIMDGAALVSQLKVYSNTTIECLNKSCGFYQIDHSDCSIITNAVWDTYSLQTCNISLLGGTYNQNCPNQEVCSPGKEALQNLGHDDYPDVLTIGIEFYGIKNLLVRDVTIYDFRTYAFTVGGFQNVVLENVWLELKSHLKGIQDGFHFWGPGQYLTVRNCGGKTSDDIINLGSDERDLKSSITDVLIDGLFLDDAEQAVRLLSCGEGRLDRITIRNVIGQYRSYGFYIDPWYSDAAMGNYGNILIENVDLRASKNTYDYRPPVLLSAGGNIECLTLKNFRIHDSYDNRAIFELGIPFQSQMETAPEDFGTLKPQEPQHMEAVIIEDLLVTEKEDDPEGANYIEIYDKVENLILRNITVVKKQKEPNGSLIRFGKHGKVENLIQSDIYTQGLKSRISYQE